MTGGEILYLHGFNSSPKSVKVAILSKWLASNRPDISLQVPGLDFSPAVAMDRVTHHFFQKPESYPSAIMGSSLGGYYALYLAAKYRLKAAVVNPAVRPFELLQAFLGHNVNLYSGLHYCFTDQHIEELLTIRVRPAEYSNGQILTLLQTGDQTLDYRQALTLLGQQPMWIFPGGNHEFENFELVIPSIIGHLQG